MADTIWATKRNTNEPTTWLQRTTSVCTVHHASKTKYKNL